MIKESTISVFIKEMRVNVRIGLCDFEREAPQPLLVSVELFTAPGYLSDIDDGQIIDYALVYEAVKAWEVREHVELIEAYLCELLDLAFGFEKVTAARVSIGKLKIFKEVQQAGLSAYMRRDEYEAL